MTVPAVFSVLLSGAYLVFLTGPVFCYRCLLLCVLQSRVKAEDPAEQRVRRLIGMPVWDSCMKNSIFLL
jgi:hypothetical protein